jgi:tRNA (guanine37-N1)-methyltransferase
MGKSTDHLDLHMTIDIISIFPGMFDGPFQESIVRRAQERDLVRIWVHDLREFAQGKHQQVDDYPYGGGAGMVMKPDPLFRALRILLDQYHPEKCHVVFPTPQGIPFHQRRARDLSHQRHLIFICGHYKGIDQRVRDRFVDEEISVGDYVLTGGELPVMIIVDTLVRLIPGALGDSDSADSDSFEHGLLDCPYYTRPEEIEGMRVPDVLLSGHHANIEKWRKEQALVLTRKRRPDLLNAKRSSRQDEPPS